MLKYECGHCLFVIAEMTDYLAVSLMLGLCGGVCSFACYTLSKHLTIMNKQSVHTAVMCIINHVKS